MLRLEGMGIFQHEGHCVENEYDAIEEDDDRGRYDSVRWHRRCNGETKLQKIRSALHYSVQ